MGSIHTAWFKYYSIWNISVLASSEVDHGFKLIFGETKNYKIVICCAKHTTVRIRANTG